MKVLCIGAHADDIEPQMGGTILKYRQQGHDVLMCDVIIPCEDKEGVAHLDHKKIRHEEAHKAASILGAELVVLDLDPYEVVYNRKLVQAIDRVVRDYMPDVVYTHWNHDMHQDHVAVSNATFAATRKNLGSLYMYAETIPGGRVPYAFHTQAFVDISDVFEKKIESVLSYKSQVKKYPFWVDALRGRAMYHGYQIGVKYAEAFEVVRLIKHF